MVGPLNGGCRPPVPPPECPVSGAKASPAPIKCARLDAGAYCSAASLKMRAGTWKVFAGTRGMVAWDASPRSMPPSPADPLGELLHVEISDGNREERQQLRREQSADHRDPQWLTQFRSGRMPSAIGAARRK